MPNHSTSLLLSGRVDRFTMARIVRATPDDVIAWAAGQRAMPDRTVPVMMAWAQLAALGCKVDFTRMAKELAPLGDDEAFAILENWPILADRVRAARDDRVPKRPWAVWRNGIVLHLRTDGPVRMTFPLLPGGVLAADGWIVTAPPALDRTALVMDATRAALGGP